MSYRTIKRVLGESSLERKCRVLFGISMLVLMVTALNELGDIERAVQAGTDDFLSKPVNKIERLKRVENMLKLKDVRDENERLRRYIEKMEESDEAEA